MTMYFLGDYGANSTKKLPPRVVFSATFSGKLLFKGNYRKLLRITHDVT